MNSLLGLLFVALLILKLAGYISLSWWLVTLPLWIGLATFLVISAGIFTVAGGALAVAFFLDLFKR